MLNGSTTNFISLFFPTLFSMREETQQHKADTKIFTVNRVLTVPSLAVY